MKTIKSRIHNSDNNDNSPIRSVVTVNYLVSTEPIVRIKSMTAIEMILR